MIINVADENYFYVYNYVHGDTCPMNEVIIFSTHVCLKHAKTINIYINIDLFENMFFPILFCFTLFQLTAEKKLKILQNLDTWVLS